VGVDIREVAAYESYWRKLFDVFIRFSMQRNALIIRSIFNGYLADYNSLSK
jgi:hypothetical protein